MKFLFDNQISYRLAEAIDKLADVDGDRVFPLRAKFPQNTDDLKWINDLASEGDWIIVSGDCRIRSKPAERKVFLNAKLTTFFQAGTVVEIPFRQPGRFKLLSA